MTSFHQTAANRRNSARSTGPRTSTGKARSSRNAFAHGLATRLIEDPAVSAEIETLAHKLVASSSGLLDLATARDLVEAQLEVRRVRNCQVNLLNLSLATTKDEAAAIQATLPRLKKLERYARRSHSHLKSVLRSAKRLTSAEHSLRSREGVRSSADVSQPTLARHLLMPFGTHAEALVWPSTRIDRTTTYSDNNPRRTSPNGAFIGAWIAALVVSVLVIIVLIAGGR